MCLELIADNCRQNVTTPANISEEMLQYYSQLFYRESYVTRSHILNILGRTPRGVHKTVTLNWQILSITDNTKFRAANAVFI